MRDKNRIFAAFLASAILAASYGSGLAAPPAIDELTRSWRTDADLAAVDFVDPLRGWAVGDRGAIWHTNDAGAHWHPQESGVACRLVSVCFLDAANGWIAGGYYDSYVHRSRAVVLRTTDGGASWQIEPTPLLPALRRLEMTSPTEGWAVGDASTLYPAGLFFTRDSGRTWNPPTGRAAACKNWRTADFASSGVGAAADVEGSVHPIDGGVAAETPQAAWAPRAVRGIELENDGAGWLVGDGGLVLTTDDGGATWGHPGGVDLSAGAASQCDWRSAARSGSHAWIVGSPGSIILHTTDAGRTWETLRTGQSLPLADVEFVDPSHGFAVGAMGTILATTDGGATWKRQSSTGRRAALWACFADARVVPAELIVSAAADEGCLTAVTLMGRRDDDYDPHRRPTYSDRAADALSRFGASTVEQAWSFPLPSELLQLPSAELLSRWGDGDEELAAARAQSYLVRQVRMLRPDVVLTHAPAPRGDAATDHLLHQLVMQAVEAAADPARFPEQIEMLGLQPHRVQKVFGHDPRQMSGTVALKSTEIISRLASTPADYAEAGRALLNEGRTAAPAVSAARLFVNRTPHQSAERQLFAGLTLPQGGDARRNAPALDGAMMLRLRKAAERQRNLQAVVMQKSGRADTALVGQVRDFIVGLDERQAGRAVFQLAETFRTTGRWEAARETYEYLLSTLPDHADSEAALHRMVHYLASGEADLRLRRALVETTAADVPTAASGGVAETLAQASEDPAQQFPDAAAAASALVGYTGDDDRRRRCLAVGAYFERRDPAGSSEPTVRFPLRSARRRLGLDTGTEALRDDAASAYVGDDAWRDAAAGEQALATRSVVTTRRTHRSQAATERPTLDGKLDDAAWTTATPLEVAPPAEAAAARLGSPRPGSTVVLVTHDAEYLYLAAVCRRVAGEPVPPPTGPRRRDADLSVHDRIDVCLDVDRDAATFYQLTFDHRGWTRETCWGDESWNPSWFVASGGDDDHWIVEAAVPWNELAVAPPKTGDVWSLGVRRVAPSAGVRNWTDPASAALRPETFGYLTFE
jgi:photosystem II stability/assembly factor-like uncharacterized protein/tetratricopeptide (TPR) repeat protein